MFVRSTLLVLAILPVAAAGVAAGAPQSCKTFSDAGTPSTADDIITCELTSYLSCADTLDPAGKLHDITVPVNLQLAAPTTSFTAGGGCGVPEVPLFNGVYQNTPYDFDIAGYVEGNIDTLTVELHDIHATQARQTGTMNLNVRIAIDGASPFGSEKRKNVSGTEFDSPLAIVVPVTLVPSSTRASDAMFFTVTNLGLDLPQLLQAGKGAHHAVAVTIGFDALNATGGQVPVWGATEVPASITINGAIKGKVIDARTIG